MNLRKCLLAISALLIFSACRQESKGESDWLVVRNDSGCTFSIEGYGSIPSGSQVTLRDNFSDDGLRVVVFIWTEREAPWTVYVYRFAGATPEVIQRSFPENLTGEYESGAEIIVR